MAAAAGGDDGLGAPRRPRPPCRRGLAGAVRSRPCRLPHRPQPESLILSLASPHLPQPSAAALPRRGAMPPPMPAPTLHTVADAAGTTTPRNRLCLFLLWSGKLMDECMGLPSPAIEGCRWPSRSPSPLGRRPLSTSTPGPSQMVMFMTDDNPYNRQSKKATKAPMRALQVTVCMGMPTMSMVSAWRGYRRMRSSAPDLQSLSGLGM